MAKAKFRRKHGHGERNKPKRGYSHNRHGGAEQQLQEDVKPPTPQGKGKYVQMVDFQRQTAETARNELLSLKLNQLLILVYGPRLPGAKDFETIGFGFSGKRDYVEPFELKGNICASEILTDMLAHELLCSGIKFKDQGNGKNYIHLSREEHLHPKERKNILFHSGPTIQELIQCLRERNFHKNEIFVNPCKAGGAKHTIKFYPVPAGQKMMGIRVKPVWSSNRTSPFQSWELQPVKIIQP